MQTAQKRAAFNWKMPPVFVRCDENMKETDFHRK